MCCCVMERTRQSLLVIDPSSESESKDLFIFLFLKTFFNFFSSIDKIVGRVAIRRRCSRMGCASASLSACWWVTRNRVVFYAWWFFRLFERGNAIMK